MSKEAKEMLVAQAKFTLKQAGYFVDNLWCVDDVMYRYDCEDENQAQYILKRALTNDATMEQIWLAIDIASQDEGLKLKK